MNHFIFLSRRGTPWIICGLWCCVVGLGACTVLEPDDGSLHLLFYNVENLFDAVPDGSEYDEFTPAAGWDSADVTARLERLGAALGSVRPAPDIVTIAEIENGALLDTLFDRYFVDVPYPYRVFSRNPGGATGIALVSRYPIKDVRTLQARAGAYPPLRPVLEVRIALPKTELVVFVSHWKSKRGGAAATEPLRRASARLIASRLRELARTEPELPIVLCGDLNENPREGEYVEYAYQTALLTAATVLEWETGADEPPPWYEGIAQMPDAILLAATAAAAREIGQQLNLPVFVDGWARAAGDGSYWFYGRWEQIDQIMMNPAAAAGGALTLRDFSPVRTAEIADGEGRPISWFDDRDGVSDHLPVLLQLSMEID
ncbi:MAG: endonuclease/exonuclease/phosphatase family protein [Spirochaeta sp.]|jgi:endonuclease/exonuclease/phosphatase family metal-dependent hydrolase|nr:endonuclease/exonuclease/phosphatase family protein [Spirochaeta sp.]